MSKVFKTGVKFHPSLFLKLGGSPEFKGKTILPGKISLHMCKYSANIDAGYNHLFVSSDIVEYIIVGETLAPVRRMIPLKASNAVENDNCSKHINHEITNLHYAPISKSRNLNSYQYN